MKKIIMLGIGAVVIGGLFVGFSSQNYRMYRQLEGMIETYDHICDADFCDTSYLLVPGAYLQYSLNFLFSGLALGAFGLLLLVMRRREFEQ